MRDPDFILIGAAKSGTTTLYRYLLRHRRVYMPTPKEPQFFSDAEVHARGLDWYRGLFAEARPDQICGEASTTYTRWPHTEDAASRIAAELPAVKLVYIMRHPVERAFSHYVHHMRGGVTMSFEEALEKDDIYVDCGFYMKQIQRYLDHYPPEALHPILLDDLESQPESVLHDLQCFLGLEPIAVVQDRNVVANSSSSDHYLRALTTARLRRIPGMGTLIEALPVEWRRKAFERIRSSALGHRLTSDYEVPPMRDETRMRLLDTYSDANQELAAFLGRELVGWSD